MVGIARPSLIFEASTLINIGANGRIREIVLALPLLSAIERHYPEPGGDVRLWKKESILKDNWNSEERDIIERFERDELRSAPDAEREIQAARLAARKTFLKTRRVNLRATERDLSLPRSRAREEGIPYQTLLSSVIHKYLSGRLVERK